MPAQKVTSLCLPDQFQTELHLPTHCLRATQLSEAGVAYRERSAGRAGQIEGRCVRQIEGFRPELHPPLFPEVEILENRKIQVALAWPTEDIAAGIPKQIKTRYAERGGVKPLAPALIGDARVAGNIRPERAAIRVERGGIAQSRRERKSGFEGLDS